MDEARAVRRRLSSNSADAKWEPGERDERLAIRRRIYRARRAGTPRTCRDSEEGCGVAARADPPDGGAGKASRYDPTAAVIRGGLSDRKPLPKPREAVSKPRQSAIFREERVEITDPSRSRFGNGLVFSAERRFAAPLVTFTAGSCKSLSHELAQGTAPRRARLPSRQSERGAAAGGARADCARKGAAGFTFADAARMAGVSPAAPYRHFRDRDELLVEHRRSAASSSSRRR